MNSPKNKYTLTVTQSGHPGEHPIYMQLTMPDKTEREFAGRSLANVLRHVSSVIKENEEN